MIKTIQDLENLNDNRPTRTLALNLPADFKAPTLKQQWAAFWGVKPLPPIQGSIIFSEQGTLAEKMELEFNKSLKDRFKSLKTQCQELLKLNEKS